MSMALAEVGGSWASEVVTAMTSNLSGLSVANVLVVIAGGLALAIPLVGMWFGFRWIYKRVKSAFKGKGG